MIKLEKINNAHDKAFRNLLDIKENAIEIIDYALEFNPNNIEKYDSSFVSEELKSSECDVVYKVKDK